MIPTEQATDSATEEIVIVVPADALGKLPTGFSVDHERVLGRIFEPGLARGMPRSQAELDPRFKQLVGYVLVRHAASFFHYRRLPGGGESRLAGRRSVGLGGHLNLGDVTDRVNRSSLERSIRRELAEEALLPDVSALRFVGVLNDDRTDVSRVHLGVVVLVDVGPTAVTLRDPSLADGGFDSIEELSRRISEFEDWSRHCVSWLSRESG